MQEVRVWFFGCGVRAVRWVYRWMVRQALDAAAMLLVAAVVATGAGVRAFDRIVQACASIRARRRAGQVERASRASASSSPSAAPAAATYADSASIDSNSFNTVADRSGR